MRFRLFLPVFVLLAFMVLQGVAPNAMAADTPIGGYAWSDNIGWISFNCSNTNSCGTVPYGMSIASDGTVSGYAWSDNIGWISAEFRDVSGCPSSPCTPILAGGVMSGWLKALAGGTAQSGGWDGWISLSGPGYGVRQSVNSLIGFAWGSDNVGWTDFNATISISLCANGANNPPLCTVCTPPLTMVAGVCTSSATGILTLTPTSCTIAVGASTCTVVATWTTNNATSPSLVDTNVNATLSTLANNASGLTVWVANPQTVFDLKDGSTVLDTKTALASCAPSSTWNGSSCVANVGGVTNGACSQTHYNCSAGTLDNTTIRDNSSYWIWDCLGLNGGTTQTGCPEAKGGGHNSCSNTSPAGDIQASPNRVLAGTTIHLTWSATGVPLSRSCTVTGTDGFTGTTNENGSCEVAGSSTSTTDPVITSQTTYTLTCDGTVVDRVTVNVVLNIDEF